MGMTFLFNFVKGQYRTAKLYSHEVIKDEFNGEKLKFHKIGQTFKCGEYDGKNNFGINLLDGLRVNTETIVLFSTDHKIKNIRRGDKVLYEEKEYSVEQVKKERVNANTTFQRLTENRVYVIHLV